MPRMDNVIHFLENFRKKKVEWEIFFKELGNAQVLANLEMRPTERNKIIDGLNEEDYCEGPIKDCLSDCDIWVFGKNYKGNEIFLKIIVGWYGEEIICVTFCTSENKISYPLKKTKVA